MIQTNKDVALNENEMRLSSRQEPSLLRPFSDACFFPVITVAASSRAREIGNQN